MDTSRLENAGADRFCPKILIVDDDPAQRIMISRIAVQAGLQSVEAGSSVHALALVAQTKFDLLTLDIALEDGVHGIELLQKMRALGFAAPTVLVTGAGSEERQRSRAAVKALGVQLLQSFSKPLDLGALRCSLTNARYHLLGMEDIAPLRILSHKQHRADLSTAHPG